MAIEIRERFEVAAPVEEVWRFVMDPHRVVTCLPGAELQEVVDERTFVGRVRVKVGAVTGSYTGQVRFVEVDEAAHRAKMVAEGREKGGGTARATMESELRPTPSGGTEIVATATVDLTGRIMQVGRGMIQGVSHQLFRQFVEALQQQLEVPRDATGAPTEAPPPVSNQPIRILPVLLRAIREAVVRFFRRLFGRNRT